MASQGEEIIARTHLRALEHLGERCRDRQLGGGARRLVGAGHSPFRFGQLASIDLAVQSERQRLEPDDGRGHHRLG